MVVILRLAPMRGVMDRMAVKITKNDIRPTNPGSDSR